MIYTYLFIFLGLILIALIVWSLLRGYGPLGNTEINGEEARLLEESNRLLAASETKMETLVNATDNLRKQREVRLESARNWERIAEEAARHAVASGKSGNVLGTKELQEAVENRRHAQSEADYLKKRLEENERIIQALRLKIQMARQRIADVEGAIARRDALSYAQELHKSLEKTSVFESPESQQQMNQLIENNGEDDLPAIDQEIEGYLNRARQEA